LCNFFRINDKEKEDPESDCSIFFSFFNIWFRCEEEDKTIETYQDPLLDPDIVEAKVEDLAANQAKTGVFQMLDRLEEVTDDLLNR
jgi:hypothetical protein